jgi:hypothetical protein
MKQKGSAIENWNWQTYDRKNGIQTEEQEDSKSANFDIMEELEKVTKELQANKA